MRPLKTWAAGLFLFFAFLGAAYPALLWPLEALLRQHFPAIFEGPYAQMGLVHGRLLAYVYYFPALCLGAGLLYLTACACDRGWQPGSRGSAAARRLFSLLLLLSLGLDLWFSEREWQRFGRPCWDNYCYYEDLFREAIFHPSSAHGAALLTFMQWDRRSNSPIPPLLVALLSQLFRLSIIHAYRLSSVLCTLGSLLLFWFRLMPALNVREDVRPAALLLLATHLCLARSMGFPQTDPFVLLWTLMLLCLCARGRNPVALWVVLTTGLFVKLSFLPALALVPIMGFAQGGFSPRAFRRAFFEGVVFSLVPLGCYLLFQHLLGTSSRYSAEFKAMHMEDSSFPLILEAVLQTGFFPLLLVLFGWRRLCRLDLLPAVWVALYWGSLWAGGTPGWDRYYLASVPALVLLSSRGLERLADEGGAALVAVITLLCACLNYLALLLYLYH